jgi:hypothetical protein
MGALNSQGWGGEDGPHVGETVSFSPLPTIFGRISIAGLEARIPPVGQKGKLT